MGVNMIVGSCIGSHILGSNVNQNLMFISANAFDIIEYNDYTMNPLALLKTNKDGAIISFYENPDGSDNWLFSLGENGELYANDFYTFSDPEYPWMGYDWNEDGIQNNVFNLYVVATLEEDEVIQQITVEIIQKYIPVTKVIESSDDIFNLAHGTCQKGDTMFIGTRSGLLVSFNDPNDLTDYTKVTLPGVNDIEAMVYDVLTNKIYATCLYAGEYLKILSINPADITDYSTIYDFGLTKYGNSQSIDLDGTHIYLVTTSITSGGSPSYLYKIRISDFQMISSIIFEDLQGLHAIRLHKFTDRTEAYLTNGTSNVESVFIKVNCTTMSYQIIEFGKQCTFTDDFALKYIDESGCMCYLGCETALELYAVNTSDLVYSVIYAQRSFGVYIFNGDLYNVSNGGEFGLNESITKYPLCNLLNPITKLVERNDVPNELFYSDDKLFYTAWGANKLVQFEI